MARVDPMSTGAEMSRRTAEAVLARRPGSGDALDALRSGVGEAAAGVEASSEEGSGSTLTAVALSGDRLALVHIGDGRVHLLRDGVLTRLTDDHTVAWPLLDEGSLTEDGLASHPERAHLTQALTPGLLPRPDTLVREVRAGDRYLVSSDGLHAVLPRAEILAVLQDAPDPAAAVAELVRRVLTAGAPDNVACAVGDVAAVG
jgi:PPM family protein phosphatase